MDFFAWERAGDQADHVTKVETQEANIPNKSLILFRVASIIAPLLRSCLAGVFLNPAELKVCLLQFVRTLHGLRLFDEQNN